MSNYLENKLIDWLLRAQAFTPPATTYVGLFTASPADAGGGTEVSGGNYARAAIVSGLTQWAGTQSSGSTVASSGTGGTTSNNAAVTFNAPSANWGTIVAVGLFDALTVGNLLFFGAQSPSKTVNNGDAAPSFAIGALQLQIDN
jgi:hypothetical protein